MRALNLKALIFLVLPLLSQESSGFHGERLPSSFFANNRQRLIQELKKMGPGTLAIVKSMPLQFRNGDTTHAYRQDSDFYYLTGVEEPESVALIHSDSVKPYTLLVRAGDARRERYDGPRLGIKGALALGADAAERFPEADGVLQKAVKDATRIVLINNFDDEFRKKVLELVYPLGSDNSSASMRKILVDGRNLVGEMRLIKQPIEIEMIQKAVDASIEGHRAAMERSLSATNEGQVAGAFEGRVRSLGARFLGYDTIAGAYDNTCVLHYPYSDKAIFRDQLFLMDAGAEIGFYTADITRTWPVDGSFSHEQAQIYRLVYGAQEAALAKIKPGARHQEGYLAAMRYLSNGLVDLGILKGDKETVFNSRAWSRFTIHGISHWLGLDVHDTGSYRDLQGADPNGRILELGMVLTVEPGLYIPAGSAGVETKWHGIGVRIEDDVLVTPSGYRNLSEKLPRSLESLERFLQSKK
jgi:Xaa-Pro aminopeptidase